MPSLFLDTLEISVLLTPLIILMICLIPIFERRYSPKLQHLIWLALAVRLFVVWNPTLEFSITPTLLPSQIVGSHGEVDNPNWSNISTSVIENANVDAPYVYEPNLTQVSVKLLRVAATIWASGAIAFLGYQIIAYLLMKAKLKKRSVEINSGQLFELFIALKNELGIRKKIQLYTCNDASGPFLIGLINPQIIIPRSFVSGEQADMILRHELQHFKRHDLWFKLLLLLVRGIHWFNPTVHFLSKCANRSIELCCDNDVLRVADDTQRKAYGFAILSSLEAKLMPISALHSGFSDGKVQMKKRFLAIVTAPPKRLGVGILSAIIVIAVSMGSLISCMPVELSRAISIDLHSATSRTLASITPNLTKKVQEFQKSYPLRTAGWLKVNGTDIDAPVLLNALGSNSEFVETGFTENGSYFSDYRSTFGDRFDFSRNTVIYGKSSSDNQDGEFFSQLLRYKDPAFAKSHPYIIFSSENETIVWEIFAVFNAHVDLPYILSQSDIMSNKDLLAAIRASSIYKYNVEVRPEDKVLTLSTNAFNVEPRPSASDIYNYRFAIVAKMVSPNELSKSEARLEINPTSAPPDTYKIRGDL